METYSQIGQDILVLSHLKNKTNGTFVDIGCGYPTFINNTYLLEKNFGWKGLSIDLVDFKDPKEGAHPNKGWDEIRPESRRVLQDALKIDYKELFKSEKLPNNIDFLSIDLEPPHLTFECLMLIPFDEYTFNFISFETDEYREGGIKRRDDSREFFKNLGYILVGSKSRQDDFYVHKSIHESNQND